jgi:multidrug efflux system membrane fusion protein
LDVTATIPGGPGKSDTGRLLFVDNVADPETAMVSVRARFENADESLWPGETVEVTLTLATLTNAVVVPSSAVRLGLSGPYLLVVKPDLTVERRPVTTGNRAGGETIIASGLQAGERLITTGQERVIPGKHLKIPAKTSHAFASSP